MYAQVGKSKKGAKKQPATGGLPGSAGRSEPASQFVDCRPEAIVQRKLQGMVNNSTQVKQLKGFIQMANNSPQAQRNREYAIDYNKPVPGPMGEPGFIATPGNPLHQPIQRKPEDFGNLYLSKLKTGFKFSGSKTHPFSDDSPFEDLKDFVKAYSKLNIGNINGRQDQLAKIKRQVGIWRAFYTNTLVPRYELTDKVDHFARKSAVDILEPLIEAEYAELGARDAEVNTKTQTLRSIRFQGDYILEEVAQGNVTLTGDEAGIYVLKVQRALIDSGKLADDKASKKFDAPTKTAIKGFQGDEAITQSENLDADTMNKMDEKFRTYAVEGAIAKNKPANITGTHVLDPHEKRGVKSAISTGVKVNVVTGELPTFTEDIGHMDGNYKARVKAKVEAIVESQYRAMGHGKGALHSDESNLLEWDAIKSIGGKSKEVVDAVFGKYKKGPAMKPNVSIFDAWDYKENILKKVKAQNAAVNWRVRKIITGKSQIREIDREHGAVQSRNAEKKILDEIIAEVTLAKRRPGTHPGVGRQRRDLRIRCRSASWSRHARSFAEARIVFSNGCVAELKASRINPVAARQMSASADRHLFIDFGERRTQILKRSSGLQRGTIHVEQMAAAVNRSNTTSFRHCFPCPSCPSPRPIRSRTNCVTSCEVCGSHATSSRQGHGFPCGLAGRTDHRPNRGSATAAGTSKLATRRLSRCGASSMMR